MQASELLQRMGSNRTPLIIDARGEVEFKRCHIRSAINVPVRKLLLHSGYLPPDKGRVVVVTCEHGHRTAVASALLSLYGYRNTEFLEGSPESWKEADLPLDTSDFGFPRLGMAVDRCSDPVAHPDFGRRDVTSSRRIGND